MFVKLSWNTISTTLTSVASVTWSISSIPRANGEVGYYYCKLGAPSPRRWGGGGRGKESGDSLRGIERRAFPGHVPAHLATTHSSYVKWMRCYDERRMNSINSARSVLEPARVRVTRSRRAASCRCLAPPALKSETNSALSPSPFPPSSPKPRLVSVHY